MKPKKYELFSRRSDTKKLKLLRLRLPNVWGYNYWHKFGWSQARCCRTVSIEQPTASPTWFWTYYLEFRQLLETMAPTNCCFLRVV